MNSDPLNSFLGKQSQDSKKAGSRLTMGDILELPERQQQIVNWIMRQKECSLADLARYLGEDEAITRQELDELVQHGIVQETQAETSCQYSVKLASKRGSRVFDRLEQTLTDEEPKSNPEGE